MSYRDSNSYSASTSHGTLPENYQVPNEALERAEFDSEVGRYNKKPKPTGFLGRLKAIFVRPAR